MPQIASPEHCAGAGRVRRLMAKYAEVEMLLQIGEYKSGSDPLADEAIAMNEDIEGFVRQRTDELADLNETRDLLCGFGQA